MTDHRGEMLHTGTVGVLGGGNVLRSLGLEYRETEIETRYGAPSDRCRIASYEGLEIATILRHGRRHQIAAHKVNYRANIEALNSLGVKLLFGVSTCGAFRADVPAGTLVLYDQILDLTRKRIDTFFAILLLQTVQHVGHGRAAFDLVRAGKISLEELRSNAPANFREVRCFFV